MVEIKTASADEVRNVRKQVFALEQGYPEDKLFDNNENTADFLALYLESRVVGCGRFFNEGNGSFHIDNIALSEEIRGGGYGRKLVVALVKECVMRGAKKVTVNAKIEKAGFYEKCGFFICGSEFKDENFIRVPMVFDV